MTFSQDFIEKVRDANNLIDILSEYTSFKRSGHQHMACCPLPGHNEKTPSFSASELKQVYHCFGCGKSGNIFDALRELKGFSFPESIEYLATRASIAMPSPQDGSKAGDNLKRRKEKADLIELSEVAADFFQTNYKNLKEDHPVRAYAEKRGLDSEIQQQFRIGYAPDDWEKLGQYLTGKKLNLKNAEKLNLVRQRSKGEGKFDMFRHRLMFPIQDLKGDVIGFGGRVLDKEQTPKYLNSPESDIFHKGKTLYGLSVTGKFIREQNQVLVVEGYMDLLALYSAGIKNVVATLGTAFTEHHARLIKRFTENIILVFDGDNAGMKAAERSLPILLQQNLVPKIALIPDKKDPDDYVKEVGKEKFQKLLKSSPEVFQWILSREMSASRGTPADKLKVLNYMASFLDAITDDRLKALYSEDLARRLEVDLKLITQSLGATEGPHRQKITQQVTSNVIANEESAQSTNQPKISIKGAPKAELYLLNLALSSFERWHAIWGSEITGKMSTEMQKLWHVANDFFGQNPSKFDKLTAYLINRVDEPRMISFHLTGSFLKMSAGELDRMQDDCKKQLFDKSTKTELRQIKAQMQNKSPEDQLKELERIVNIKRMNTAYNRKAEPKES